MASEPNIVEIYVDKETKEIYHFLPATGTLDNGEELPETAVFCVQINIDDTIKEIEVSKKQPIEWKVLDEDDGYCD